MSLFFQGWDTNFLGWESGVSPTAPAPSGTASHPKRFVLPHDMSKAARILAGDHDALLIVEAIVTSGVLQ